MVSLILKHFWVYKEIYIKYDCADNFVEILDKYMAELPADYDMLFIL